LREFLKRAIIAKRKRFLKPDRSKAESKRLIRTSLCGIRRAVFFSGRMPVMVSMKDIARKCQVSVATVSKALNGYSDIGKEKREEILQAAKEMGYFPNSSARALKTNRTYNLGILFSDNLHSGLTHDYFAAIIESFKVTAEEKGYDITFTTMNSTVANRKMTYYEHCRYRGLDGVVIANIDFDTPEVTELVRSSLPVVTIDYVFDGRIAVVSDNMNGMKALAEYVCRMGHRKIAYIHGDNTSVTRDRLSVFYRTMDSYMIKVPDNYILPSRYRDVALTAQRTRELLNLKDRPDCILFPDDFSAVGGINEIREAGLRIPEDISVAGFDGIEISRFLSPKLTTLRQDSQTIGVRAADSLISLIESPKTTLIEKIVVPGELVEGESVRNMVLH
jgi:DNA-binding LacI/PurR family transcriptional regulator